MSVCVNPRMVAYSLVRLVARSSSLGRLWTRSLGFLFFSLLSRYSGILIAPPFSLFLSLYICCAIVCYSSLPICCALGSSSTHARTVHFPTLDVLIAI